MKLKFIHISFVLSSVCCSLACKTTQNKAQYYSYEKDLDRLVLRGPIKKIQQFGAVDTIKGVSIGSDKLKYYTASFAALRFDEGGNSLFRFDTFGMITYRQSLKKSINQKFSDTVRKHRMHIYHYEYNKQDVADKLQYKQTKKNPWFVHNPYRVKISSSPYQAYTMKMEQDSTHKKVNYIYIYIKNKKGLIVKEEKYFLYDKDLDGNYDEKDQEYYANYIYNEKDQLIRKEYTNTDKSIFGTTNIDDFNFNDIPKSYSPVIEYEWDDRGNLIKVTTIPNKGRNTFNHIEEYYYNDKNKLIKMRRNQSNSILRAYNRHSRSIHDLYFDDKSNVIKVEAINDDGKTIYSTYLYDYSDYDAYGNWTTSNSYLDGDKTKKPNMVTKRIIKYYEKNNE